jgi:hypothetical protein
MAKDIYTVIRIKKIRVSQPLLPPTTCDRGQPWAYQPNTNIGRNRIYTPQAGTEFISRFAASQQRPNPRGYPYRLHRLSYSFLPSKTGIREREIRWQLNNHGRYTSRRGRNWRGCRHGWKQWPRRSEPSVSRMAQLDGWVVGRMEGWVDRYLEGCVDGSMGQLDEWMGRLEGVFLR